jgi:hypothetical protein
VTKLGADIEVGDEIEFLGRSHRVLSIEEYDTSAFTWGQPGTRIARATGGWGMTLFPGALVQVAA